jgi:hypothetical protein
VAPNSIPDNQALERLQRQIAWARGIAILSLLGIIALAIAWFATVHRHRDGILRTHGIVVTDAQGHGQILIGTPALATTQLTEKYGRTNSIVFLDADGHYRLAMGQAPAPVIDGKAMQRIGDDQTYGTTLYDARGNERGGMGFIGGAGRAVFALDRPTQDAIGMMVDDKSGFAGMIVNYANGKDSAFALGTQGDAVSMTLSDPAGSPRADLKVEGTAVPAWQFSGPATTASSGKR